MLAYQAHAATFGSVYESGLIDCQPRRLPYSVGDPHLVPTATSIVNGLDVFSLILWRGDVDLGIIGTGQIDVAGNLNTTVIGEYGRPTVRLTGSGGATDIAMYVDHLVVVVPHSPNRLVREVDFITSSPAALRSSEARLTVVTTMGSFVYDSERGRLVLDGIFEGHSVDEVDRATGWDLEVAEDLRELPACSSSDSETLEAMDPSGLFLR